LVEIVPNKSPVFFQRRHQPLPIEGFDDKVDGAE